MPPSDDGEPDESIPRLSLDLTLDAGFVCEIPEFGDAEQTSEPPPAYSNSGDLSVPADTCDVTKEGEQPMGFIQSRSFLPEPSHLPRPLRARAGSQDPKARGMHDMSCGSYRAVIKPQRANLERFCENRNTISSPPHHVEEHLSPNTLALMRSETPQPSL